MTSTPLERHREANADIGDERARFSGTVTDWEFQLYAEAAA